VVKIARDGSWVLYCQARVDTNGDGQLASVPVEPGYFAGDSPALLLTLGSGAGVMIDGFEAATPDGGRILVTLDGTLYLLDVAQMAAARLPNAPVAVRDIHGGAFSDDGQVLAYGGARHLFVYDDADVAISRYSVERLIGGVEQVRNDARHVDLVLAPPEFRGAGDGVSIWTPHARESGCGVELHGPRSVEGVVETFDAETARLVGVGDWASAPAVPAHTSDPLVLGIDSRGRRLVASGLFDTAKLSKDAGLSADLLVAPTGPLHWE
jgi:hypothetical protein